MSSQGPHWVAAAALAASGVYAQPISVGPNVRISHATISHVEPHVAAHRRDPDKLLVSVSHFERDATIVETYSSGDAGATWSKHDLPALRNLLEKGQVAAAADTRVDYGADGEAYCLVNVILKTEHPWGRTPILFYRSSDNGRTWAGPAVAGPMYDRPTMLVSGRSIYVTAMAPEAGGSTAAAVLESTDRGASFQRVASIAPDSLGHQPMGLVHSPGGALVIPYLDFPRRKEEFHTSRIYVVRSTDGGSTFGPPIFVTDIPRASPGSLEMVAGQSAIYAAWNGGTEARRNLMVARSIDEGNTWVSKVVSTEARFGSLAVAGDGTLGVAWIQHLRNRPYCWNTYFSFSVDGGQTFANPTRVSTSPSCPSNAARKTAHLFKRGDHDYGDYMGLAATADGVFHPVWLDARSGVLEVYTAAIRIR